MSFSTAGPSRPSKPPVVQPGSGNAIIINPCQRLNPTLECIRNVNKEFGDIVPDFQLGRTTCALFLSLKYHRLHPEYIHQRIQKLGQLYTLRLLVLMCDVSEHQEPIRELTKICLVNNITIVISWSNEEAGVYLATYKAFEHKPPDLIKERVDKEYNAMLRAALTSISKVNKTDVETLRTTFGSFAKIAHATPEELRRLPGFGQVKVRRIVDAFDKPFRNKATSALSMPSQGQAQAELQLRNRGPEEEEELELLGNKVKGASQTERDATIASYAGTQSTSVSSTSNRNNVHKFGSAADMPTPPATTPPGDRPPREPSPIWDIELDLNLPGDEVDAEVDPRLAKKAGSRGKPVLGQEMARREANSGDNKDGSRTVQNQNEERREQQRSPSPVWDIELDLNDDD